MGFRERFADALEQVPADCFDQDRFVPGVGDTDAAVMLVGEAPGANEVEHGEPFVGRAGEVLDEILEDVGVSRDDLYITNVVKVRPPDNRDPTRDEIEAWTPVLEAEIDAVDPDTIITLGNFATKELTGTDRGITRVRGRVHRADGRKIIPAYHPAATLYDRSKRPVLEKDIRAAFGKPERGQTTLG